MDLTQGSVSKQLVRFSIPIIIMQILNQAYGIADSVIVSRYAGEEALSVMSATMAVLTVGYCLVNGAGSACHIIIASFFGQRRYDRVKNAWNTIAWAGLLFSCVLALIYILFGQFFFEMVELPPTLMAQSVTLLRVYALSFGIQLISSIAFSVLNGLGDSKTPMVICTSTQILNILLDVIVVAWMDGGVIGAAFASIFSLAVSAAWGCFVMKKKLNTLSNRRSAFETDILGQYIRLTVPSMLQQSVMSIGSLLLQRLVNVQGTGAINGYTIACNINNFFIIPIIAFTTAYETFASQNLGAQEERRAQQGFQSMLAQCGVVCVILSASTLLLAKPMISLYLPNASGYSFQFAYQYILILIPNFFGLLLKYSVDALFKAHMKIYLFTISSLISLGVRILFSYIFVSRMGLLALAAATVVGNVAAILFNWTVKKVLKY